MKLTVRSTSDVVLTLLTQQVELGQLERQQTRKAGAALPEAEALLLATQQADRIYGKAFQEFTLQVRRPDASTKHRIQSSDKGQSLLHPTSQQCLRWQCVALCRTTTQGRLLLLVPSRTY